MVVAEKGRVVEEKGKSVAEKCKAVEEKDGLVKGDVGKGWVGIGGDVMVMVVEKNQCRCEEREIEREEGWWIVGMGEWGAGGTRVWRVEQMGLRNDTKTR